MRDETVKIHSPTGERTWIKLSPDVKTVKQLKEKAVKELPWIPGQGEDNVRLTLDGKTLEDSTSAKFNICF
ncbi:hypothetical protein Q5P01_002585 [Channa striata]|uniref:Ubiquitin-like domain-containing protein n=1 Tax=Channa striata TaxID=64152 RepID=A0AA88NQR3_CHASR|nr:hypothetical protein Q5P01_002585 [Channa striata]